MALVVSGCAVGPNYKRPAVNAPTDYRGAQVAAQQASFADLPWWEVFKDERLRALVQTALANNYDLRVAITRIEQSRQIAAQARAQYFPFINYSVSGSDGKNEFAGSVVPNGGQTKGAFVAAASVAWEADVWGKLRRLNESARAQYLATEEARRGVMLTLVSDVAQNYFLILGLELQLDIAKQTTISYTQTLKLFTQRLEGGVSSALDTSRAAATLATAAATVPEIEREIALAEDQLSVLMGSNPGEIAHTAMRSSHLRSPRGYPPLCWSAAPMCFRPSSCCGLPMRKLGWPRRIFSPKLVLPPCLDGPVPHSPLCLPDRQTSGALRATLLVPSSKAVLSELKSARLWHSGNNPNCSTSRQL
jgi:multidrug efflux system outer membrane protein